MRSRRTVVLCLVTTGLLLLGAMFLWFDNPEVDVRASDVGGDEPAGKVGCSIAPWDAGLNDNRDGPGGEHSSAYSSEVAADCYSANMTRFASAIGSGVLALATLFGGVAVGAGPKRRTPAARR